MDFLSALQCSLQLHFCPTRSNQPLFFPALRRRIPNTKLCGGRIGPRTRTLSAGYISINNSSNIIIINNNSNNSSSNNNNGSGGRRGSGDEGHDSGASDGNDEALPCVLKKAKEEPETVWRVMGLFAARLLGNDIFLAVACGMGVGVIKVIGATNGLIIARKDVVKEIDDKVEEIPVVSTPDKVENKEWSSYFQIKAELLAAVIPTESSMRGGLYQPAATTKISAHLSRGSSGQSGKGGKA